MQIKLQRYSAAIKEAGYDELEFLMDAEEADLDEMVTDIDMKKAHIRTFKRNWKALVGGPAGSPAASGGGSPFAPGSPASPASPAVAMPPDKFFSNGKLIRMGKPEDATHGLPVLMGAKGEPLFA